MLSFNLICINSFRTNINICEHEPTDSGRNNAGYTAILDQTCYRRDKLILPEDAEPYILLPLPRRQDTPQHEEEEWCQRI